MRILLCCQQALRRHEVPAYGFWENYFKLGLTEAGHEILEVPDVDWAEGLEALSPEARVTWLAETWARTKEFARSTQASQPIDLLLGYFFPWQVAPAAVMAIRRLGIPCVNFFCDNIREFTRVPDEYVCFDLHWVPEAGARRLYAQARLPFVHAPMAVAIPPKWRSLPEQENPVVAFVGSHDLLREELLGRVARDLPLQVYGAGWTDADGGPSFPASGSMVSRQLAFLKRYGLPGFFHKLSYKLHRPRSRSWISSVLKPMPGDDAYVRILRESAVTLGINRYPSFHRSFQNPGSYSRLRDIEAPMLGACYLTEATEGIDSLYELGVEIETYHTADELVEKARALLASPERRKSLRERGQSRALGHHTIGRSIEMIRHALRPTAAS